MRPSLGALALLPLAFHAALANPTAQSFVYPNCAIVKFTATVTAANKAFPLNVSDPVGLNLTIVNRVFTIAAPITVTSNIVARYCEPEVKIPGRANSLEFLLQSITNNKNFWSGLGEPGKGYEGDAYSWIAYASKRGYATLSLDRLGNGQSDHPDPLLVVQGPYEYALYHALVQQIQSGKGSPLPRAYTDVILIGNSFGSVIVDNMLSLYPTDVSKAILTGYTYDGLSSFPGITAVAPAPAAIAIPGRFGNLAPGYLTTTSVDGRRGAYYGLYPNVLFPYNITVLDNNVRDVVSIGQFLSNYLDGATVAPSYSGRVLVLTGEKDDAFCGPGNVALETTAPFYCGARIPDTKKLFPKSDYSWYSIDRTGHSISFHDSRFESFKVAHDFLDGAHFSKTGNP